MISQAEQHVSRFLRMMLANLPIGASLSTSEHLQDFLSGLCFFLPELLREWHPEWKYESLDGIYPLVAKKTGEREAEVLGECILISDQTLTPIHLLLQATESGNEIAWLELKLGELGQNGMVRTPYQSPSATTKRVYGLADKGADSIDWVYKITFGDRRP